MSIMLPPSGRPGKRWSRIPLTAALLAEKAGADGITVHLREDRRHIQDDDVFRIREKIKTVLNLEMAAVEEMVQIALKTKPYQVSLVPEKRQEITTEGGLDVISKKEHLKKIRRTDSVAGDSFQSVCRSRSPTD